MQLMQKQKKRREHSASELTLTKRNFPSTSMRTYKSIKDTSHDSTEQSSWTQTSLQNIPKTESQFRAERRHFTKPASNPNSRVKAP